MPRRNQNNVPEDPIEAFKAGKLTGSVLEKRRRSRLARKAANSRKNPSGGRNGGRPVCVCGNCKACVKRAKKSQNMVVSVKNGLLHISTIDDSCKPIVTVRR